MNRREFLGAAGVMAAAPALAGAAGVQSSGTASLAKQMRITGLETDVLHFPGGRVYYDAIHEFGGPHGGLVLRLVRRGNMGLYYFCFLAATGVLVLLTLIVRAVTPLSANQSYFVVVLSVLLVHYYFDHFLFSHPQMVE